MQVAHWMNSFCEPEFQSSSLSPAVTLAGNTASFLPQSGTVSQAMLFSELIS